MTKITRRNLNAQAHARRLFPDPDIQTTERLLYSDDKVAVSASILSAVVTFLCGSTGREQTATILREWADAVEASRTPVVGHG